MKKITLFVFFLLGINTLYSQTLVINEIMSTNTSVITDDDGEYQDWIEIYYNGAIAFNLEGYGLSDDVTLPYKWVFPEYWIEPGDHLVLWCSDKNRTDINNDLHTNFKIGSGGEIITLTKPDGSVADTYPAVVIGNNISYGRQTDGASTLVFFAQPTPWESNTTQGYSEVLVTPSVSAASGFFTSNFPLTVSHPDPSVTIVYTLDGSDPELTNVSGTNYNYKNSYVEIPGQTSGPLLQNNYRSFSYSTPITISDRSSQPNDLAKMSSTYHNVASYVPTFNIFKGTVVRVRAFKAGALPSPIVTKTYFVSPQGSSRFTLPVVSLSLTETKFFEYEDGIFVAGKDFDDWRALNPTEVADNNTVNDVNANANYVRSGSETEQVGNISYFVGGNEVLNQNLGIRINGGNSRNIQSKALRLYARSEYGSDAFNYPFFSDENYTSYKRLVLRNSGQDFYSTLFRDAFTQDLVKTLKLDTKAYQPSIVFVNGEYWGILNLRERYDDKYFKRVYGIDEIDLDYLKDDLTPDTGDNDHYFAMTDYMEANSLDNQANYNYITTQLDPENFRDYNITNIYAQNTDWPGWNTVFWRKRTVAYEPNAPYGQDGRWRAGMNDLDDGFGNYPSGSGHNTLEFATATGIFDYPNPEWSTLILRKLLENNGFKLDFINRFADMLNTYFLPSRVVSNINLFKARIQPEIQEHIDRWESPETVEVWDDYSIQQMINFANTRPTYQRQHIRNKFGITGDINATLDVDDTTHGYIKINTIEIKSTTPGVSEDPYPWTGIYFQNIPVTLKAIPLPGYIFSHWTGASTSTNSEITITSATNFSVTAHFVLSGGPGSEVPIYFWNLDTTIANDTPLTSLNSTFEVPAEGVLQYQSCLTGYPFDATSPNWRKASMERRNSPTDINYIPEANNNIPFATSNMRGIQIKQPFTNNGQQNALIFNVSSLGYRDLKFAFAAKNELAAEGLTFDYSTVSGTPNWISTGLSSSALPLTDAYQLFNIDFVNVPLSDNNQNLKIRVRFTGANLAEDLGNRVTFNNFSVRGVQLNLGVEENTALVFKVFPNPTTELLNIAHTYTKVDYNLYTIDGKLIKSGELETSQINIGGLQSGIYLLQLNAEGKSDIKKIIKR
jgi:hypothetical protein